MRSARLAFVLLPVLSGCGERDSTAQAAAEPDDNRIECRIANSPQFDRFCTIEYGESDAGGTLVVRKPDGGFRRLLVARDGRGVVAADGAEQAEVTIIDDDRIEVTIGGDTFRLPATVRAR
jgi:hypothetical protein